MLDDGDPIVPRLNSEIEHLTKPPVTYWALAASVSLLGRNEWALRLPNALAFVATALLAGSVARRLGSRAPWIATLVYATSLLPAAAANVVTTDTLLALFETAAVAAFVAGWRTADPRRGALAFDLMWVAFGAAFLTKGPPGLVPLLPIAALVLSLPPEGRPRLFRPVGLALGTLVGLSWFGVMVARRPDLLSYFVGREVFDRVATDAHGRNGAWYGALVVYGPALLVGLLPWTPLVLGRPATWFRRLRETFGREGRERDPSGHFLGLAVLLPLAVFAIARSRLAFYVLPLFVPLALVVARRIEARGPASFLRSARVPLVLWMATVVFARGIAAALPTPKDDRDLAGVVAAADAGAARIVFVGSSPHWGLLAYFPAEIVRREIPSPTERPLPPGSRFLDFEDLDVAGTLFLVPLRHRREFESLAAAARRPYEHVATAFDLLLYRFRPERTR